MSKPAKKPEPHPGAAALAISFMALAVAGVLVMVGVAAKLDLMVVHVSRSFGLEGELRELGRPVVWVWTAFSTIGLCQAMLHAPGNWRRLVLFLSSLLLTLSWIPVLALASYAAPIAVPLAAILWGGFGSEIYAVRHREPE
ncbi:hypothetical protein ACFQY0_07970 [Haloferula chungangensis]|uniref:Uncharacterized protein n=1 Tax=Haloferula chungangensis TaxID=1048331 RepID=A0ABW2L7H9_9BACT